MYFLKFINPALQDIGSIAPKLFGKLEEAGAGLHVTGFVNNYDTQHSPA